ncbi:MAG TPA: hypothetical protein GXZ51_00210 [Acholeplasma sp.]|jgi:hypothetical protein|nr:hypothetical protein [Acholeplasma sp.]
MNKYIVNKQDAKKKKLGANLLRAVSILAIVAIVIVFFITIPATAETEEAIEAARIKTLTYRYAFSFLVFVILSFFVIIFNEVLGGLYNLLKLIIKLVLASLVLIGGVIAILVTDFAPLACQVAMPISLAMLVYAFIPTVRGSLREELWIQE